MTNYNYNGMNAHDIANKVIAKEEAYNNAKLELMPFEVKCHYALQQTPIIHPFVSPRNNCRRELLNSLRPELLRRAENEDAFALYVLGQTNADLSAPATDDERRFLERSMNAGYISAAIALLDRFYHGKKRFDPEAERILSWLSEHIGENSSDVEILCYHLLSADKKNEHDMSIRLAMDGDYCSVMRLANLTGNASDFDRERKAFWDTVVFIVLEYFYNKGAKHLGDTLGMMLIKGRGCVRDLEKIKNIYVDLMMNYEYDRHQLLTIVGAPHNDMGEDLYEAERVCRMLIENDKKTNYWRLILIALLSGSRQKLECACDEVCKVHDGLFSINVSKAYHMLRHAAKTKL